MEIQFCDGGEGEMKNYALPDTEGATLALIAEGENKA